MKYINKLFLVATASALFVSCADLDYTSDLVVDKPADVSVTQFINGYDVLSNYIDRSANPNFKLGMAISASDFVKKETAFSLALVNFNEVAPNTAMYHGSVVQNDGTLDYATLSSFLSTATGTDLNVYGPALCWHANQNANYLNELIAPTILPDESGSGTTVIADFESNSTGDTFSMTGNGSATIVADPAGKSGNVMHIDGPANYSYPKIEVTLPEGRKLADYKNVKIDFYGTSSTGLYGTGMRLAINNVDALKQYNNPSTFGCPDGDWGRGMIVLDMAQLNLTAEQGELTTFTLIVGSGTGAGNYYIDNIKMDWESSGGVGSKTIADFESDDMGTTYEMSNGGSATVVVDPSGKANKVANIISNQSHPKFNVELPSGITLGHCTVVKLLFYGNGSTGRYGQGMRLAIDDSALFQFPSPDANGCKDDQWGGISLDLTSIELTEAQKSLRAFTMTVGSATGAGNYYIDDVTIHYERNNILEKTPEEKEEILSEALETYIAGVMQTSEGAVKVWNVVNEPMSDDDNLMLRTSETDPGVDGSFYWQDYLTDNYARYAITYARKYFKEFGGNESDLKLFVNDYGLEKQGSTKCQRLIEMIRQWEGDGTRVDGIATQMQLAYSLDPAVQQQNEENVLAMYRKLAESGKLIRISGLTISVEAQDGSAIETSKLTLEQQMAVSDYYDFIVRQYFEIIPAAQRYGITLGNPVDTSTGVGLWNTGYNRKYTYVGFSEGLAGE